jgi:hypothetical protein
MWYHNLWISVTRQKSKKLGEILCKYYSFEPQIRVLSLYLRERVLNLDVSTFISSWACEEEKKVTSTSSMRRCEINIHYNSCLQI